MEVGLKKESPITYSNGKRLFTIDQKVDALVRIKMTGCSKAEVARSLHVAESTFRGWFKNKDIVMKAEVKYNEMKTKSSSASSDGYKSDDNSKSFSVDGSDNNSSTYYTDDKDGGCSPSRFGSPDPAAVTVPVRRSPERIHHQHRADLHHLHHHNKQKLKKQQQLVNNAVGISLGLNNNNNNNNNINSNINKNLHNNNGLISVAGLNVAAVAAAANLGHQLNQQHQLQHHLSQLAHHPLHQNLSSLGGLNGTNITAAAVAAAAVAASAVSSTDHASLRLTTAELQNKINNFFGPSPLMAASLPAASLPVASLPAASLPAPAVSSFIPPTKPVSENSFSRSSDSFINTMVTATLMEPQALDLSTHSRNKCINPRNPLWQLQ